MAAPEDAIDVLRGELRRYPADRYPVQHATARFHLGVVLTNAGALDAAEDALGIAAGLFEEAGLRVEHAKATNALGAVRRLAGEPAGAVAAFEQAAVAFAAAELDQERGAALFNLGLAAREAGRVEAARDAFAAARPLLDARREPAAVRELGSTLFVLGDLDAAANLLGEARALADRAGDELEVGAAANALGLVHLAAGRPREAAEALRIAAGSHPRSVRPPEFAMAKANLALAHEREGDAPRARLAARQALAVPDAPGPVSTQARAVLERLGPGSCDLTRVLEQESGTQRAAVMREVAATWTPTDAVEWLDGQLAGDDPDGLAESLLGAALELPPAELDALVASLLAALRERGVEQRAELRGQLTRGAARFHLPQMSRLEETFRRLAQADEWS